ncbi:MAG: hypothetical protein M3071_07510 [Actinomycetota bacterium]|nr:hypothetical protein [Actinomycetota bacterium]
MAPNDSFPVSALIIVGSKPSGGTFTILAIPVVVLALAAGVVWRASSLTPGGRSSRRRLLSRARSGARAEFLAGRELVSIGSLARERLGSASAR